MNSNQAMPTELAIWKEIAGENLSVSHDRWHLDRVLSFAQQLQAIYGGDLEVITAAVLMHDLGRSDPNLHGQASIDDSTRRARQILDKLDILTDKAELILQVIAEHDQPELKPSTIEARILKDADFLGGFGAWGVLRICMWAGETRGGIRQILDRLEHRMPKRVEHLEFPESGQYADQEIHFVNLFLSLLQQAPELPRNLRRGKYIIIEGISGAGKDTQAKLLRSRLEESRHKVTVVHEPAEVYKELRDAWQLKHQRQIDDPEIKKLLIMADRYEQIQGIVKPALDRGEIVVSVRSFVSTLIYQCTDASDRAATVFVHRFVPTPDLVLLCDLDAETAWQRIQSRKEQRGMYEKIDLLEPHRALYRDTCNRLFRSQLRIVDASPSIEKVNERIWELVKPHLS